MKLLRESELKNYSRIRMFMFIMADTYIYGDFKGYFMFQTSFGNHFAEYIY